MVITSISVYVLLLLVLNFSPTRQWLTNVVTDSLEDKLQTSVSIGEVEVDLFNRVTLKDVVVKDQSGEVMLNAGLLSAKIELLPLLSGQISLRTISLLDGYVNLYTNKKGEDTNFQFVVDAFKSKSDEPKQNIDLRINSLILRRCDVSFDHRYLPETPGRFNPSHIGIKGLDANVSLKKLATDSLNLRIRSFAFLEKSGLDVKQLSLRLAANKSHCDISHFLLRLPNTHIIKEGLQADYDLDSKTRFWNTLKVKGALGDAQVATEDIACLIPELRGLNQVFTLTSDFLIKPNVIIFKGLRADEQNDKLHLIANLRLDRKGGLICKADGDINRLFADNGAIQDVLKSILKKDIPSSIGNVGDLYFNGKVHYVKEGRSLLKGEVQTAIGDMEADMVWKDKFVSGRASFSSVQLQKLFDNEKLPSNLNINLKGEADFANKAYPAVKANLVASSFDYNGKTYNDVRLDGSWKNTAVALTFASDNPGANLNLDISALFDGKLLSNAKLSGHIRDFSPKALALTNYFGDGSISAQLDLFSKGTNLKNPDGYVQITDFSLNQEQPYHLSHLELAAVPSSEGTMLNLKSDFGSLKLNGPLSVADFSKMLSNLVGYKLPGTFATDKSADQYKWQFDLNLVKSDFFSQLLHLPVDFTSPVTASGYLSSNGEHFYVSAIADDFKFNSTEISDFRFLLRNDGNELASKIQLNKQVQKSDIRLELDTYTQDGRVVTDLTWGDLKQNITTGQFKAETSYNVNNKAWHTMILPTEVMIKDTLWNIIPGNITFMKDSVNIKHFAIQHADQSLSLSGRLSRNPKDSVVATLHKLELNHIMSMVNTNKYSFSGIATGKVSLANTFDSLQLHANLDVPNFAFNEALFGHALIQGSWNLKDKRINLLGDITEEGVGSTLVRGYVSPADQYLDLRIDSKNTNVFFLNKYVEGILGNVTGRTTGYCRVYGPFKGIDFEGKERVNLNADIMATGVRYNLKDGDVIMSKGKFEFSDFKISDFGRGSGLFSGVLSHNHLKNLSYVMNASTDHLLVYDKDQSLDMPFYATAYGSGKVIIKGKPGKLNVAINMRPEKKTEFVYTVDSPDSFGDVQLLHFGNAVDSSSIAESGKQEIVEPEETAPTMDIKLDFKIDMNPEATLKVIMDRKTGDHLIVHGYGPITASFYNKGSFQMFGRLNVDRGVYKMSIQDVIRKDFEFTQGSFIDFSGDPFMGDLGLRAIYVVNSASLSDLNIGDNFSDNSVRVNCVLNFSGKVKSPQVSFDLELPTVSEDVQHMVRNLISSEEDMNMQILYLLGVGRFYTYNYSSTAAAENQSQSAVAMKSFLSNTLSSQLNNIISNAVGSSNWSFGANLSTGSVGWSDMEVEGILSGRLLNNRLLINGNFGYRDRPTYSSTTNFIGDFDVRYLLTPSGGVSLKAYSETNDRYFSKSSLSTQGIGIMLKRDFSNIRDLFTPRRKRSPLKKSDSVRDKEKQKEDVCASSGK